MYDSLGVFTDLSLYKFLNIFFPIFQFRPTVKGQFLPKVLLDVLYYYFYNIVKLGRPFYKIFPKFLALICQ